MAYHLSLFKTSSFFFFIILPAILCQENRQYADCRQPFRCSNLQNIEYPFWGGNRQDFCGLPGFQLDCSGDAPLITIMNLAYRVLSIDSGPAQTLTVARNDLWTDSCAALLQNTTLDFARFDYVRRGYENVTINYGCTNIPGQTVPIQNQFDCPSGGGRRNTRSYFVMENGLTIDFNVSGVTCDSNIFVPVNESSGLALRSLSVSVSDLRAALTSGFELRWTANNTDCRQCTESGGICGSNTNTGLFACHCANQTYPSVCGGNGNGNGNGAPLSIALPLAGAVLAGIGVGWLIFFCRQRKKRLAAQAAAQNAQSADSESKKDLLSPPSSKGLKDMTMTHPSTHFTQSIPSYPSLKSEAGKNSSYFGVQVFSYDELEEATDNFDPSKELGDGGFGAVYYGKLNDGRIVAVKRLYENNFKRVEQFMNEVEILTHLRHENLVVLYGCTSKRSRELLLVYEYIPNGTVADHLNGKRAKSGLLSWPIRLNIAVETAEALSYLHSSDIIHRDVKTTNILLDNDFHVKVADFGLSRLFPTNVTHVSTAPQGTPGYVDPEYYQCYQLTEKSDVYSFGVVLIELISSLPAVDTNRHRHDINLASMAVNKIQNRALNELVDPSLGFETTSAVRRAATLVAELAFQCLQQDKDMRPSMKEVVEVLRGIQNDNLNGEKVEVVEILMEDVVDLKDDLLQLSPDSVATGKSIGGSTTADSSV